MRNEETTIRTNHGLGFGCLVLGALLIAGCDPGGDAPFDEPGADEVERGEGLESMGELAAPEAETAEAEIWDPGNLPVDDRNVCFSQGRLPVIARAPVGGGCDFLGIPDEWSASLLVDKLPPELLPHLSPSDPYRSYCEYVLDEAVADADAGPKYDELVWVMDASPSISFARDAGVACVTAMPMTGLGDDPALEASFSEIFFNAVGHVENAVLTQASGADVNIFLVDNWAGDEGTLVAKDEHGKNLARLLEELTSGTGGSIDIVPLVGLPRMDGDAGVVHPGGGVKGTAPDLSVAFMNAALLHIEDNADGTPARSIVNASLGGPTLSPHQATSDATRSLIDASRTLACLGVQLNVAAGNELPHETICALDTDGLLFPGDLDAAFPAPSEAECLAMGYAPTAYEKSYAYEEWQPNAISGVDAEGNPLPNGRSLGSHTKIVANGVAAHTTATDSFMLTGTSVSTAVMSAASALKWWLNPSYGSAEITDEVAYAGTALEWTADAGNYAGEVAQMIDICATIKPDLEAQSVTVICPTLIAAPYDALGPLVQGLAAAADVEGELFSFDAGLPNNGFLCDGPDLFDMTDAMVNPSPTRPACDNCTAGKDIQGQPGNNTAYLGMTLAPWSTQLTVQTAYLFAYDSAKTLHLFPLTSGEVAQMNGAVAGTVVEVDFTMFDLSKLVLQLNYSDDVTMTVTSLPVWSGAT